MRKHFNARIGWTLGIFLFLTLAVVGIGYLVIGEMRIPEESPLANPEYEIPLLNDIEVEGSATQPPQAWYPVNQLYNGKNYRAALGISIIAVIIVGIFSCHTSGVSITQGRLYLACSVVIYASSAIIIGAKIFFAYGHLRAAAQPYIDESHHFRVIAAYILLGCEKFDCQAKTIVGLASLAILGCILALSCLAEHFIWKCRQAKPEFR